MNIQATSVQTAVSKWKGLYKAGGVSALVIGILLILEMIIYIATSAPNLADAAGWFALFQNNRFIGLLDFGILELYGLILFVPYFSPSTLRSGGPPKVRWPSRRSWLLWA